MIKLRDLSLRRGTKRLFADASLAIHDGYKVGVLGRNGAGKSSLLELLRGELHPDSGAVELPQGLRIAYVRQETAVAGKAAIEHVIDGYARLREIQAQIQRAEESAHGVDLAGLYAELEAAGGYTARARAGELLRGLGFSNGDLDRCMETFSGGWRMRLHLAQALMHPSDLLLLDEPTNHLDLDAVLWLEQWLQSYPATLILISHDRDFLDRIVDHILHLDGRSMMLSRGDLSDFERQYAARLAVQQTLHAQQQRESARIRAFVERFRSKATKARQAQSRLKVLERMESIALAHVDAPLRFGFSVPTKLPDPLLRLEDADAGYAGRPVLRNINLVMRPGARLGLVGPNGAGKSTLIKLLAGVHAPLAGKRIAAEGLKVGYFAQHQLEQLDAEASPVRHLQRLDPKATEHSLRDYLGGFGFEGDRAFEPTTVFSGGEKARLALAILIRQRPNVLLLDEPTNHLDLEMRDALTLALEEFEGALITVSHDRYLLGAVSDSLLLVWQGEVRVFEGDLSDYRQWVAQARAPRPSPKEAPAGAHTAASRRAQRQLDADERRRRQPLLARVGELEQRLSRLNDERKAVQDSLSDPAVYADPSRLKQLLVDQARLERELEDTESAWLLATEALDALPEQAFNPHPRLPPARGKGSVV